MLKDGRGSFTGVLFVGFVCSFQRDERMSLEGHYRMFVYFSDSSYFLGKQRHSTGMVRHVRQGGADCGGFIGWMVLPLLFRLIVVVPRLLRTTSLLQPASFDKCRPAVLTLPEEYKILEI